MDRARGASGGRAARAARAARGAGTPEGASAGALNGGPGAASGKCGTREAVGSASASTARKSTASVASTPVPCPCRPRRTRARTAALDSADSARAKSSDGSVGLEPGERLRNFAGEERRRTQILGELQAPAARPWSVAIAELAHRRARRPRAIPDGAGTAGVGLHDEQMWRRGTNPARRWHQPNRGCRGRFRPRTRTAQGPPQGVAQARSARMRSLRPRQRGAQGATDPAIVAGRALHYCPGHGHEPDDRHGARPGLPRPVGRAAPPAGPRRLPVGPRADAGHAHALHHRGGVRDPRRRRRRPSRRDRRGTVRHAVLPVLCADIPPTGARTRSIRVPGPRSRSCAAGTRTSSATAR